MEIYDKVRKVPSEAKKEIKGGRLKGMTDINPMWRIKKLTEIFGICGIGWKYQIVKKEITNGGNNEIAAFVDINLYINQNGEWSDAIPGTGGSMFVSKESKGLYTNDECFKMALTDALSVSCKALGFGADVYWEKDRNKYSDDKKQEEKTTESLEEIKLKTAIASVIKAAKKHDVNAYELSKKKFNESYLKKLSLSQLKELHAEIIKGE